MTVKTLTGPKAAALLGISYRQLDHWATLAGNNPGTGKPREFNTGQMTRLANVAALVRAGLTPTEALRFVGQRTIRRGDCTITVDLVGINRRVARAVAQS